MPVSDLMLAANILREGNAMSLRFENNRPVGLDWPAITTRVDPEVWANATESLRRTRPSPASDGEPRPARPRISPSAEREIIRLYRDELLSANEVARIVGVQSATVFKTLKRHKIPSRSKSEGMKLSRAKRAVS